MGALFLCIYHRRALYKLLEEDTSLISTIFEQACGKFPLVLTTQEHVSVISNVFRWRNAYCYPVIIECVRACPWLDIDRVHTLYLDLVFTLGYTNTLGGFALFDVLHFLEEDLKNNSKNLELMKNKL